MDEWVECTVARIRALRPHRVIEIGVGTGLLLTRLLDHVESYTALDVSSEAIEQLRSIPASHLQLLHREATDLDDLPEGGFDTVIINSVVQYFPDVAYTRDVIERVSRLVAPGGHVFVGDVRDLRSHLTFHRSLALARMKPDAPARRVLTQADLSAARDREVVLDPDYFALLAHSAVTLFSSPWHLPPGATNNGGGRLSPVAGRRRRGRALGRVFVPLTPRTRAPRHEHVDASP